MADPFLGAFRNARVFLSGHTGFKGAWLTLWLLRLGAVVKGFALRPATDPSLYNLLQLSGRIQSVEADIRDGESLAREIETFAPEFVFHLAAQPLVRLSYREPVVTFHTNVLGTVNLLEAVRSTPSVRSVVCVTTDKCYEPRDWVYGYREIDQLGGHDPYSASKACAEIVAASYRKSYFDRVRGGVRDGPGLATARAGNVIGGGDWAADRLIPDCVRSLSAGKEILVRNPTAVRPWQHVLEALSGYLALASELLNDAAKYGSGWNFGPTEAGVVSVQEVVDRCVQAWGSGCAVEVRDDNHLHEAPSLTLDISRACRELHWRPVLRIEQAIEATIQFYREHYERGSAGLLSLAETQIESYERTARDAGVSWSGR